MGYAAANDAYIYIAPKAAGGLLVKMSTAIVSVFEGAGLAVSETKTETMLAITQDCHERLFVYYSDVR